MLANVCAVSASSLGMYIASEEALEGWLCRGVAGGGGGGGGGNGGGVVFAPPHL